MAFDLRPDRSRRGDGRVRAGRVASGGVRRPSIAFEPLERRALLAAILVDAPTDTGAGSGDAGDLRYAITLANREPGSTIRFDGALAGRPIRLNSALPDLARDMTIEGPGASLLSIVGGGGDSNYRAFAVDGGIAVRVSGLTFSGFRKADDSGGAIANFGDLTLVDDAIAGNSAGVYGGGLVNFGTLTLIGDAIAGNSARSDGGGVDGEAGSMTISRSTISGNSVDLDDGGGIRSRNATLSVADSIIRGNSALGGGGGGISNDHGTVTVAGGSIDANRAGFGGGLASVGGSATLANLALDGNSADLGGGIACIGGAAGITGVTFSANAARDGGGLLVIDGDATVAGDTFAANTASDFGGGLFHDFGTVALTDATLSGNRASLGGGVYQARGILEVGNSILAGNAADLGPDSSGLAVSLGFNLIGAADGGAGWVGTDLLGTTDRPIDPLLAPLGDYGGPTRTFALLPGSPAIDSGTPTAPRDQRGVPRPQGPTGDIGSFESRGFSIVGVSGGGQSSTVDTPFAAPLVARVAAVDPAEPVVGGRITLAAPISGASASITGSPATIGPDGSVSVGATADARPGSYAVTASAAGLASTVVFALTNARLDPAFGGLSTPRITYGTASLTLAGHLAAGADVPAGAFVRVALGPMTRAARVDGGGNFRVVFDASSLGVANSPYGITYTFDGDPTFSPATDRTTALEISPAPLTIIADPRSKAFGAPLPDLTGVVVGLVAGDGITARFSTTATAASDVIPGGYPIAATPVDPRNRLSNYAVTIRPAVLTITGAATTVGLDGAPTSPNLGQSGASPLLGQSYTLSAVVEAVDPAAGTPDGLVRFFDGDALIGSASLSGGRASISTSSLGLGPHAITARYAPGPDYVAPVGDAGPLAVAVVTAETTTILAATLAGRILSFEATVRGLADGSGVPTGIVQFRVDGTTLDPVTLVGGLARASVSGLSDGPHTITAFYLGGAGGFSASPLATGTVSLLSVFAGTGKAGFGGDKGPASQATFDQPSGLAVDRLGNVYVADTLNNRIRRVDAKGIVTTVAGTGVAGHSGDGGPATLAALDRPTAIAVDDAGDLFIADTGNDAIREVTRAGIIRTVAGSTGDGGLRILAELRSPQGVAVDAAGLHLFVSDTGDDRVLEFTGFGPGVATSAAATTVGGSGRVVTLSGAGAGGDGQAVPSPLDGPTGLAIDARGDLYIADTGNNLVRRVTLATGTMATVAGKPGATVKGDGGPAVEAALNGPRGVAVDALGNLFIADTGGDQIRIVDARGTIRSIVSGGTPETTLDRPIGIANGPGGTELIANSNGNNILSLANAPAETVASPTGPEVAFSVGSVASTSPSPSTAVVLTSQLLPLTTSALELAATLTVSTVEANAEQSASESSGGPPNQRKDANGLALASRETESEEVPQSPDPEAPSAIGYILDVDPPTEEAGPMSPDPAADAPPAPVGGPGPSEARAFDEAIHDLGREATADPGRIDPDGPASRAGGASRTLPIALGLLACVRPPSRPIPKPPTLRRRGKFRP